MPDERRDLGGIFGLWNRSILPVFSIKSAPPCKISDILKIEKYSFSVLLKKRDLKSGFPEKLWISQSGCVTGFFLAKNPQSECIFFFLKTKLLIFLGEVF